MPPFPPLAYMPAASFTSVTVDPQTTAILVRLQARLGHTPMQLVAIAVREFNRFVDGLPSALESATTAPPRRCPRCERTRCAGGTECLCRCHQTERLAAQRRQQLRSVVPGRR